MLLKCIAVTMAIYSFKYEFAVSPRLSLSERAERRNADCIMAAANNLALFTLLMQQHTNIEYNVI